MPKSRLIDAPSNGARRKELPADWRAPLAEGRLLILSSFSTGHARATAVLAARRYLVVAALAGEHWFAHLNAGGPAERLARVIECWSPASLA